MNFEKTHDLYTRCITFVTELKQAGYTVNDIGTVLADTLHNEFTLEEHAVLAFAMAVALDHEEDGDAAET